MENFTNTFPSEYDLQRFSNIVYNNYDWEVMADSFDNFKRLEINPHETYNDDIVEDLEYLSKFLIKAYTSDLLQDIVDKVKNYIKFSYALYNIAFWNNEKTGIYPVLYSLCYYIASTGMKMTNNEYDIQKLRHVRMRAIIANNETFEIALCQIIDLRKAKNQKCVTEYDGDAFNWMMMSDCYYLESYYEEASYIRACRIICKRSEKRYLEYSRSEIKSLGEEVHSYLYEYFFNTGFNIHIRNISYLRP